MKRDKFRVEWELFMDASNFDMWTVRPKKDKDLNSPRSFGFVNKEDAEKFKELVEKSYHAVPRDKAGC